MHFRIEYGPEGGGDPKAFELYSRGEVRRLTYEAMDEVLTTDISEAELAAITRLLDTMNFVEEIPFCLGDSITLTYKNRGRRSKAFSAVSPSAHWAALSQLLNALDDLKSHYFHPRFY